MSDHLVRLIPLDVEFVPDEEAQLAAVSLADSLGFPGGRCASYEDVTFIDGGENFPQTLPCQHCGHDLLFEAHWSDAMTRAHQLTPPFSDLHFLCPRCTGGLSLYDLSLREPSHGFARWVLELPATGQVVLASDMTSLSSVFGSAVRAIYVHL